MDEKPYKCDYPSLDSLLIFGALVTSSLDAVECYDMQSPRCSLVRPPPGPSGPSETCMSRTLRRTGDPKPFPDSSKKDL